MSTNTQDPQSTRAATMRAWQYARATGGLPRNLQLTDSAASPKIGPQKVMVEVLAMSVNPVDYKLAELPNLIGNLIIKKPASPGQDFAGRVVAAAHGFQAGDLVFGRLQPPFQAGALSQFVAAPTSGLAKVPKGLDAEHAAALPTAGKTAYQVIVPHVKEGDRVFINGGSGGVGTMAIQIAKIKGCHVTTSCSGANTQLCKDLGADEVIDYRSTELIAELRKKGQVFDLVADLVGAPYGLHRASDQFLKPGSRFIQIGGAVEWQSVKSTLISMLLPSFLGGTNRPFKFLSVSNSASHLDELACWATEGRMKVVLDSVYPYEQAPKAYERLKTGRARGKIIVSTSQDY